MKSFKQIIEKEDWKGRIPMLLKRTIKNKTWTRVKFREINIYDHNFENCQFIDCEFQHCSIGKDVQYKNCLWQNCYFWGQYSSLGGRATYQNCRFENMVIKNGLWANIQFIQCYFSGKFINTFLEGKLSDTGKPILQFQHCDMRDMAFENVTIKNGLDLSTTILPIHGVRLFNNTDNKYSDSFLQASQNNNFDKDVSISLKIIGEFYINQHPVIMDEKHLDNYHGPLNSPSRLAYEKIAEAFEIASIS
jgi:hypothetical protein